MYMMQQKETIQKVRDELKLKIVDPYKQLNPDKKDITFYDALNFESLHDLHYLNACFNESLRIEPPGPISTSCTVNQDSKVGKYNIKKDTLLFIDVYHLQRNPAEWHEPEKYIPERFDPDSKYFLTPSGNKRHPMSFGPFLGGKRVCLGKTFADMTFKITASLLLQNFDFEFVNVEHYTKKP